MSKPAFSPTAQQRAVIEHGTSAFICACPGAGKTRVMVERARHLVSKSGTSGGIAFLSFTNAAVAELQARLKAENVLGNPVFPNFIGTFDSFLWQFFIAPFGIPGSTEQARLIPDKSEWTIQPSDNTNELPLSCFDRDTGQMDATAAKEKGYDVATRKPALTKQYETMAKRRIDRSLAAGKLDFSDVRALVRKRLAEESFADRLGKALAARFREIIVDEAQDCNPDDLAIIDWLRGHGIATKVICDPQQAIYEFRGGITDELAKFGDSFSANERLPLSGNFRSSGAICRAIVSLRPPTARDNPDDALGEYRDDPTPVHVLSYKGSAVPSAIGASFANLIRELGLRTSDCPVVSSTWDSACNATGQPAPNRSNHSSLRLAGAITDVHFAFAHGGIREALHKLHRVLLDIRGLLEDQTYHEYLAANDLERGQWRPDVLSVAKQLEFQQGTEDADQWLARARAVIEPSLPAGGPSIAQRLKNHSDLGSCLGRPPDHCCPAKSIHSVKGMQFPAICVVMTVRHAKGMLTFLEKGEGDDQAANARRLYVAASRAERLLAIACPQSQSARLANHLNSTGATVLVTQI